MTIPLTDPTLWKPAAYINGEWIVDTGHGFSVLKNPANGKVLASLPRCKEAEATRAVETAHAAFLSWRAISAQQRSTLLRRWYELIIENREDIGKIITLEQGKPLAEAIGEAEYAATFVEWFAEEAKRVRGDIIPAKIPSQRILTLKQPIGVCAAITPWNFPAAMITRKAGPALAAGCTMVVKPASQTPMTALALAVLAERAGIPKGVFNVVTGGDTRILGGVLTGHHLVRKVTFTGSTEVGRVLLAQSAETVKKCSMELGGNAPAIVYDDADLDAAVAGIMVAKYRNTGQTCVCINRILVQDGVYDAFAQKLTDAVNTLNVGDGFTANVQQGPLIDMGAVEKVEEHIADAVAKGATIMTGGHRHALGGSFFEPTVLVNVPVSAAIAQEETFGPVAPLFRFHTEDEALSLANDSEFGLAAYLFSKDASRIWRAAEGIEAGIIGINTGLISNETAPFGGVKQSGLGREGSQYGIDDFIEIKYLAWDGI